LKTHYLTNTIAVNVIASSRRIIEIISTCRHIFIICGEKGEAMQQSGQLSANSRVSRRQLLSAAAAVGTTALFSASATRGEAVKKGKAVKHARIKQSIVYWCFNSAGEKWDLDTTCRVARDLGCPSVEIVDPAEWGILKKHKLICALAPNGMPGAPFKKGFNNLRYHDEVVTRMKKVIDACAEAGTPNVIAFTGYRWRDADDPKSGEISRDEGAKNCIKGLKLAARHAEKKGVTICLEHLNTRDDSHPMKGHPGYQGDDLDWVASIIRKVGSPRVKLLFDIYHVQVMHGDLLRRIEQTRDIIGHIHTAGNPGRGELDNSQEIQYPAVMKKLLAIKYTGYVGQEFIPIRDPRAGLRQAVQLCDV
jgi:hydroxypyruvate isomerase